MQGTLDKQKNFDSTFSKSKTFNLNSFSPKRTTNTSVCKSLTLHSTLIKAFTTQSESPILKNTYSSLTSKNLTHNGSLSSVSNYSAYVSRNKYTARITDLRQRGQSSVVPQTYALVTEQGFTIISEAGVPLVTEPTTFFYIQYYGSLRKSKEYSVSLNVTSTPA